MLLKTKGRGRIGSMGRLGGDAPRERLYQGGADLMFRPTAMSVPAEVIFNPNWWFRNYGISFEKPFYFDRALRIQNDVTMRRAMYERFGLGERDPQPRPIVGSEHVAGGFVVPAVLGCEIRFEPNAAPWPVPRNLGDDEILALRVPDLSTTWPMDRLIADMESLKNEFGHVCGDFDFDGVLNTALQIRGQQLFADFYNAPQLAHHLLSVVADTQIAAAACTRAYTGTCGVSTNRSILNVNPGIFLHSNCAVQMISPKTYDEFFFPYEKLLADKLAPYGIHHCGNNLHLFTKSYSRLPLAFVDVGWGSDVARCRKDLPNTFLNLRLNPVRMLQENATAIQSDTEGLLAAAGSAQNVGVCCINIDYGTHDENVFAMLKAASAAA